MKFYNHEDHINKDIIGNHEISDSILLNMNIKNKRRLEEYNNRFMIWSLLQYIYIGIYYIEIVQILI